MNARSAALNPGVAAPATAGTSKSRVAAIALALGFAALYVPTYWDFLFGYWSTDSHGHELLVIAVSAWLLWRKRDELAALPNAGRPWLGAVALAFGLLAYLAGRWLSQLHINSRIELSSQFVVLLALLLAWRGWRGVRVVWFPLLFLMFAMPLPAGLVSSLTMPLKHAVSAVATGALGWLDYPVGRNGVVITIGQYQLLVAEACAGLQSMFTLEAMGLLYVNLMNYGSAWRSALMSAMAIPAAFAANVVRVMVLTAVTYHFGDAAGQGFIHGFAGIVLFAAALLFLIGVDRLLGRWWAQRR
jgi:exosortase B